MSDTDKDNALSEAEFCIAMKLVLMRRKGFDIPSVLPDPLQPRQERCKHTNVPSDNILPNPHPTPTLKGVTEKPRPDAHATSSGDSHELTSDLPSFSVEVGEQILVDIGDQDSDTGELVAVQTLVHRQSSIRFVGRCE